MAPHSSTLAWKIPRTVEPGGLQSMGSWRVGHDWATSISLFTFMHWRRKWQPTPVFLPGESQGRGSLVGCRLWGRPELDTTEVTWQNSLCQVFMVQLWICTGFALKALKAGFAQTCIFAFLQELWGSLNLLLHKELPKKRYLFLLDSCRILLRRLTNIKLWLLHFRGITPGRIHSRLSI